MATEPITAGGPEGEPARYDVATSYPTFDDDPALWGLKQGEPMTEAEAKAASDAEAWGGRIPEPGLTYADWVAEGQEAEAGQ